VSRPFRTFGLAERRPALAHVVMARLPIRGNSQNRICKKTTPLRPETCKFDYFSTPNQPARSRHSEFFTDDFGTYQEADIASRVGWTRAVLSEARKARLQLCILGILLYVWVYDQVALTWREPLLGPKSEPLAI
jgi:hypothetical protein